MRFLGIVLMLWLSMILGITVWGFVVSMQMWSNELTHLFIVEGGRWQGIRALHAGIVGGKSDAELVEAGMAIWRTERTTHTTAGNVTAAQESVERQSASAVGAPVVGVGRGGSLGDGKRLLGVPVPVPVPEEHLLQPVYVHVLRLDLARLSRAGASTSLDTASIVARGNAQRPGARLRTRADASQHVVLRVYVDHRQFGIGIWDPEVVVEAALRIGAGSAGLDSLGFGQTHIDCATGWLSGTRHFRFSDPSRAQHLASITTCCQPNADSSSIRIHRSVPVPWCPSCGRDRPLSLLRMPSPPHRPADDSPVDLPITNNQTALAQLAFLYIF